ncbi:MAG: nucleoside kinase [Bdellovibrionales bacterium]|jgi:uridine kinase|nr:nucleoside kinase [Bdellovibrionales bacterium]MBT3526796.1 nucleoside kinase [Bdellovibrionales bacterium]MBT7670000.1 nucleoside kinase [Bdellovibrionales bacterium]MBT7768270.1 nucleoside kinase [Bdellovibrionales bacterium]
MQNICITYQNREYKTTPFQTPSEFIKEHNISVKRPMAAVINGHLTRLNKKMRVSGTLDLVEFETSQGQRVYESSVLFLFISAFNKLFPELTYFIQHSIFNGIYIDIKERELSTKEVSTLLAAMQEMVDKDLPISRVEREWDEQMQVLATADRKDVLTLFRYMRPSVFKLYELDGVEEALYQPLLTSTGDIPYFGLWKYQQGVILSLDKSRERLAPIDDHQQSKIFDSFQESLQWSRILKVRTVGQLNGHIMDNSIYDLIMVAEALHEKKVAQIADQITCEGSEIKVILIAGPSSSGKTTFSKRLGVQMHVNGVTPVTISLDDYFIERNKTPLTEDGRHDFESLKAIDVELFTTHLGQLIAGEEIQLPRYDFRTGTRKSGHLLRLKEKQVLVVEGIHGINPELTAKIDKCYKFKIYVSALTQLNLHTHDRISTSDTRLIRRIVRDSNFRGYSAGATLEQWRLVRAGEEVNIFPLQEMADVVFNSALFYELAVLRPQAERELLKVERTHSKYAEAKRLLKFLSYFLPLDGHLVTRTSILKEFIGDSAFDY